MPYLVLGVALLIAALLIAKWFVNAEPKMILKVLKWVGIPVILTLAVYLIISGRLAWGLMLAPLLLPWIARFRSASRQAKNFARMSASQAGGNDGATGQRSEVKTKFLRMPLDPDSGAMDGRVVAGPFSGRDLSTMALPELIDLLNQCLLQDMESAKVLETYLDRAQEDWRDFVRPAGAAGGERASAGGDAFGNGGPGGMTKEESYKILGLEPGASAEEIKAAYHRLMAALHPDKGGSTYLATKLNEAKDQLL